MFSISTYWLIAGDSISHLGRYAAKLGLIVGLCAACTAPLSLDWSTSLGESGVSAPLVTASFVAVGTDSALVILELDGKRRCRVDLGARVFTPRPLADDRLLVGTGTTVATIDSACNVVWKVEVGERVASAPAVSSELVVVPTVSGRLVAMTLTDGSTRWTFSGPTQAPSFVGPAAVSTLGTLDSGEVAIDDGVAYVIDVKAELFAVRLADGQPLWSVRLAEAAQSTPVISNGRVVVGADDGGIHALDTATHALVWQLGTDGRVRGGALFDNGVVYNGSDDRHVYAIDGDSGALRWLADLEGPVRAKPVPYRNLILVAGGYGDGRIYAFSRDDGGRFAQVDTDTGVIADLVVAGDTIYATSVEGTLYAYRVLRTFER